jgi:acyl carrier protein
MAVTEHDVEQFAARIRLHFEPALRDIAFDLARAIARVVGSQVKLLRPETKIAEIFAWVSESDSGSLDKVEWIMAIEMELGFELPDELAGRFDWTTFRELVEYVARNRDAK